MKLLSPQVRRPVALAALALLFLARPGAGQSPASLTAPPAARSAAPPLAADTVGALPGHPARNLREGTRQYLVTSLRTDRPRFNTSAVWVRRVQLDRARNEVRITQDWLGGDTLRNRHVFSICRLADFAPVYHRAQTPRGVEAFNFGAAAVVGADSVTANTKRGFSVVLPGPTLNWELDLETLEQLDYAPGRQFFLRFYHPGGNTPPKGYRYYVTGQQDLALAGQQQAKCWLLRIDYDRKNYAVFWVGVKTREVLKMEEHFNNIVRYKVRLATPGIELPPGARLF